MPEENCHGRSRPSPRQGKVCSQFSVPSSPQPPPDPGPPETLRTEGGQLGTPGRGTLGTRPDCPRRRCKRCEVRGVSHRWRWGWAERRTASHVQGRPGSGLWKHSALLQPQMRVSGDSSPHLPLPLPRPHDLPPLSERFASRGPRLG